VIKFLTASFVAATFLGIALYVLGSESEVMASSSQAAAKGDRLENRPSEPTCGDWPYYHHACLRSLRNSDARTRKVRIIQTSRRHPTMLARPSWWPSLSCCSYYFCDHVSCARRRSRLTADFPVGWRDTVKLYPLPPEVIQKVPQAQSHKFFVRDDEVVLVSSSDRRVADVIKKKPTD
jgi:hypothetical protein